MNEKSPKKRKYSLPLTVILTFFILAFLVRTIARFSTPFADFYTRTVGAAFRFIMAKLTGWFPFSLAEILVCLVPVFFFLLILFGILSIKKREHFRRFVAFTLAVPMVIYTLFVGTYAIGYHTTPLAERLSLPEVKIGKEELTEVSAWAVENAAALSESFTLAGDGTQMPYDWNRMTEKLNDAYRALSDRLPFLQSHTTVLKPILLSDPMTYTGIVGVYSFFTGESNVNTTYPDYSTVFTAAHEMAHQRGIAPENEANFIAFLACIGSADDYLRYVGYMNLLDYLLSPLYNADKDAYRATLSLYTSIMSADVRAYAECYDAHRNETVHDIATGMNDSYLQSQGTAGSVTYGLVVNLAVAYYYGEIK